MKKCILVIRRLLNEWEYTEMSLVSYKKKFDRKRLPCITSRVNMNDEENKYLRRCFRHAEMLHKQDIEYLTTMLRKHLRSWWD